GQRAASPPPACPPPRAPPALPSTAETSPATEHPAAGISLPWPTRPAGPPAYCRAISCSHQGATMTSPPQLDVHHLTRRFGDNVAVDDVSFSVRPGQMTGFVGANGAGKTSTMRMIMGVLAIHAGEVHWGGRPITRADRARFGYMPEERGLYPKQPILDQLTYLGQLRGM